MYVFSCLCKKKGVQLVDLFIQLHTFFLYMFSLSCRNLLLLYLLATRGFLFRAALLCLVLALLLVFAVASHYLSFVSELGESIL